MSSHRHAIFLIAPDGAAGVVQAFDVEGVLAGMEGGGEGLRGEDEGEGCEQAERSCPVRA
jgi:hypothetical protein